MKKILIAAGAFGFLLASVSGLPARVNPLQSAERSPALMPNLRGQVMILVYHRFSAEEGRWMRSWSGFDHDLERLEAAGYRPITLKQYVTADFDLPEGSTPVVLTFDDSTDGQVKFSPDGQVAPDCALGHWMAFAKMHPDFPVHGTWFVNPGTKPFEPEAKPPAVDDQKGLALKKIKLLVEMGNEIGNHTYTHPDFKTTKPENVEREIAEGQLAIEEWLPRYKVFSLALPFGNSAHPEALAFSGEWQGTFRGKPVDEHWDYQAVVRVGSNPAASPLVAGLDALRLPRIQVFDPNLPKLSAADKSVGFEHWLDVFDRHPERRFVSDGQRHAPGSLPAPAKPAGR